MTTKDFFLKAYEVEQLNQEQVKRDWHEKLTQETKREFEQLFPVATEIPADVVVDGERVTFNGVTLLCKRTDGRSRFWQVVEPCPECGKETYSRMCWNAAQIGEMITNFKPDTRHTCGNSEPVNNTWQHRLIRAIDDAIRDRMESSYE